MSIIRWTITTIDRVAMIEDVIKEFSSKQVNIISLEVQPGVIFIKFNIDSRKKSVALYKELLMNQDIKKIDEVNLQPCEKREKELKIILEATKDGIIGINHNGSINYINTAALNFLKTKKQHILHKSINTFINEDEVVNNLLKGKEFDNHQLFFKSNNDSFFIICSGRSIIKGLSDVIDAVITFKSIESAQKMFVTANRNVPFGFEDIIYKSQSMQNLITMAQKVAKSKYTVLIRGETGTGKELIARAIHDASNRRDKPFAPINCAAIPETLIESELFGYENGAFSGAAKGGKIGIFESANHGTLFLDEFGELSLILQSKLLRVIQNGIIRRVGGTKTIPVDVRIIVATNRNLEDMVKNKQFREDLYYRINVLPIEIPPLRKRKEDIAILIDYFLNKYGIELNKHLSLSIEAKNSLYKHDWYGNIRELQNVILRAIHLSSGDVINHSDLLLTQHHRAETWATTIDKTNIKEATRDREKAMIETCLKQHKSARKIAKEIGLSHTTVLNKIRRYQLEHLLNRNQTV